MKYERLTVKHPNGYIAITETKQLPDSEQARKVLQRLAELEDKIEQGTLKEAKKAEILVKPDTEFGLGTDWYCGNCGGFLNKFIHGNYCRYCGAELIIPKEQQNG